MEDYTKLLIDVSSKAVAKLGSPEAVAVKCDVRASTVTKWLKGKVHPGFDKFLIMKDIINPKIETDDSINKLQYTPINYESQ